MDGNAQRQRVAKNERRKNRRDERNGGTARSVRAGLLPGLFLCNYARPTLKIRQAVSRQNHPSVSNAARNNNVYYRKHGSCCHHRAVPRNPTPSAVSVSNLCRNLEAL